MGDLPLRTPTDRRLGGPLPRRLPNQTHPHPSAVNLSSSSDVLIGPHRVLIRISTGYALLRGRLDTRYSPVRRSPSGIASNSHAAPRLACVKPVASVHPEPGSNSTLYIFYVSDRKNPRTSVASRHSASKLASALAARNFVNHLPALICLRTPIRIYRVRQCQTDNVILTVRLPGSRFHKRKRQPLLVLLLCLCKHFKDLSKLPQLVKIVRKRMQRYTISANLQNIQRTFFR